MKYISLLVFALTFGAFVLTELVCSFLSDDSEILLVEISDNEENNSESESDTVKIEYINGSDLNHNAHSDTYLISSDLSYIYMHNLNQMGYKKVFTPPPQTI